jgi:hypothetical protein
VSNAIADRPVFTYRTPVPGGQYAADQEADGTWNVRGVPLLAVHKRFGQDFDRPWLEAALERAQVLYARQYVGPLHVHHHSLFSGNVYQAGSFMPTAIKDLVFGDLEQAVPVIVGDLLKIPAGVYSALRRGDLPYLSVELDPDFTRPKINSVALLEHEAPYFPFPLLTVGGERPNASIEERMRASAPLFYSADRGASTLLRLGGRSMADTPVVPPASPAQPSAPAQAPLPSASPPAGAPSQAVPYAAGAPAPAKKGGKLKELLAQLVAAAAELDEPEADPGAAQAPAEIPAGQPGTKYSADTVEQLAAQRAEIAALKRRASAVNVVDVALTQVAHYGVQRAELEHELRVGGQRGLDAFVRSTKAHGVPAPTEWTGEIKPGAGSSPSDPPEVAAYSARGAEVLAQARQLASYHRQFNGGQLALKDYLAANLEKDIHGFMQATKPNGRA